MTHWCDSGEGMSGEIDSFFQQQASLQREGPDAVRMQEEGGMQHLHGCQQGLRGLRLLQAGQMMQEDGKGDG